MSASEVLHEPVSEDARLVSIRPRRSARFISRQKRKPPDIPGWKPCRVRQPLVPVCAAVMAGIWAQNQWSLCAGWWLGLIIAALIVFFGFRHGRHWTLLVLLAAGAGFYALSRQTVADTHVKFWQKYYRKTALEFRGVIVSDPQRRQIGTFDKITFEVDCEERLAPWGWEPCQGRLLAQMFRPDDWRYGDRVQIRGKMHRPFAGEDRDSVFSYRAYLENRGIEYLVSVKKTAAVITLEQERGFFVKALGIRWRHYFGAVFDRFLSPRESGLMKAMLVGDRTGVPAVINDLFQRTGASHILAISGLHIGIIAGFLLVVFRLLPVGRRIHYILVILALVFYLIMTGDRASVWRATLMAMVVMGGLLFEKQDQRWNSMALSALFLLLLNPRNLFDLGFILSFLCVTSIFMVLPLLNSLSRIQPWLIRWIAQSMVISLSVWIGVWPVIALAFGLVVPVSMITNLWVIPLVTVVLAMGSGLMLAGSWVPWLAEPLAMCLKVTLNLLVWGVAEVSRLPGGVFVFRSINIWQVWIYYIFTLGAVGLIYRRASRIEMESSLIDKGNQLC